MNCLKLVVIDGAFSCVRDWNRDWIFANSAQRHAAIDLPPRRQWKQPHRPAQRSNGHTTSRTTAPATPD
jgi:hypothetical protein